MPWVLCRTAVAAAAVTAAVPEAVTAAATVTEDAFIQAPLAQTAG